MNKSFHFHKCYTYYLKYNKKIQFYIESFRTKIMKFRIKLNNIGKNYKKRKPSNFSKFHFSGILGMMIFLERVKKQMFCYKASNKELEKLMNSLESQIKNLEFKYHGKLRRQPIKYFLLNLVMVFVVLGFS